MHYTIDSISLYILLILILILILIFVYVFVHECKVDGDDLLVCLIADVIDNYFLQFQKHCCPFLSLFNELVADKLISQQYENGMLADEDSHKIFSEYSSHG